MTRRRPGRWTPIAAIGAATALVACGNGDDNGAAVPIADATTSDVGVPPAFVRVANWSPDLSVPRVDVCLSTHDAGVFEGPALAMAFGAVDGGLSPDGGALGVAFVQASAYVPVPPGPYDVRFVAAGADCTQGIGPDQLNAGAFASGTLTTVAIFGQARGPDPITSVGILSLVDDSSVANAKVVLRFINALPSVTGADGTIAAPTVDFGTGMALDSGAGTFKPIYVGVPFGGLSDKTETQIPTLPATATVDSHGYGSIAPINDLAFSAHVSGTTTDLANEFVSIAGGAAVTAVLLPLLCDSEDAGCPYPSMIAVYVDNAGIVGRFSPCITCGNIP